MQTESKQAHNNSLTIRLLIIGGVISPLLFTIVYLVEGVTRPGYNAWLQAASALSLSDQGWIQITNFLVCGLLMLGFALGVRQILHDGKGATWGPIMLAVAGFGLLFAGIFVTDPAQGYPIGTPAGPALHTTWHGNLHFILGALAVFGGLPASCFILARRWASDPQWKGWATYSIITGILMLVFFVAFAITGALSGPSGLLERFSLSIGLGWIALFAVRLLGKMRSSIPSEHSTKIADYIEHSNQT